MCRNAHKQAIKHPLLTVIRWICCDLSRLMRKPTICICETKGADQLRSNCEADQRLCFRYTDSTTPLLPKSEISSFYAFSVAAQDGLCRTWSESQIVGSPTWRLILCCYLVGKELIILHFNYQFLDLLY